MGTNYYLNNTSLLDPKFENCLHIGKSSGGWAFALRVYPELGINSLEDWLPLLVNQAVTIYKEDYTSITLVELLRVITCRSWPHDHNRAYSSPYYKDREEFLRINSAVEGPNNLFRARVDGTRCIGHGSGTWDLIIGYFS